MAPVTRRRFLHQTSAASLGLVLAPMRACGPPPPRFTLVGPLATEEEANAIARTLDAAAKQVIGSTPALAPFYEERQLEVQISSEPWRTFSREAGEFSRAWQPVVARRVPSFALLRDAGRRAQIFLHRDLAENPARAVVAMSHELRRLETMARPVPSLDESALFEAVLEDLERVRAASARKGDDVSALALQIRMHRAAWIAHLDGEREALEQRGESERARALAKRIQNLNPTGRGS